MADANKDPASEVKNNLEVSKALIDWSKWLIGVNFLTATGCMLVLLNKEKAEFIGPKLMFAIIFFALTVFISIVFTYLLSMQSNQSFRLRWYHHLLAGLQLLFFTIALAYFYQWVFNSEQVIEKSKVMKTVLKTDSIFSSP